MKFRLMVRIVISQHAKIVINDADQVRFTGLKAGGGGAPEYVVNNRYGD